MPPRLARQKGENARAVMLEIVEAGGILSLVLTGEKTWGREVGFCERPDELDVNRKIIRRSAALSCPR